MTIKYAVLIGSVLGGDREDNDPLSPHFSIYVDAAGKTFRVPVNVQSQDGSSVLYYYDEHYKNDLLIKSLSILDHGLHGIRNNGSNNAIDYVRGKLFAKADMRSLPASQSGPNNDLQDVVDGLVTRSKDQKGRGAEIYVFGEAFPGGVHDIHMNQGNSGKWEKDNGVWQDGGLIFYFPNENRFEALFFGFETQCWDTQDSGKKAGCCKK